jgi:hypothetical protein
MKLKGVNPIAQHIEKVVLGLTVLIFLAVISMQFVTSPNNVKAGSREVAPNQIYNELASTANALQSQITDSSPSLPEVQPVALLDRYNSAFASSADNARSLPSALGNNFDVTSALGFQPGDVPTGGTKIGEIEALEVPETSKPFAASSWSTLDPYAVVEVPEYANFVPAAQPFDLPTVSIEANFPGTTLRDILEGNDGYPGVPRLFWVSTGMAVMGLDVQRQQLQPDGSWSDSQSITTPPGTPLPTKAVTKNDGLVRLNEIIASAQEVSTQVMQPMYLPTISGPKWAPPSEQLDAASQGLTETQRLQRQLTRLTAELDQLRNPSTRPNPAGRPGGGGRSGKSPTNTRDPGNQPAQPNRDRNRERIDFIEDQIDDIKTDLERLGVEADADASSASDILDQEALQLWAHDIGVKPGATYRYRTRVVLNNPYFRKGPYLDESDDAQQALTVEPFVRANWSQWSDPVAVGAKEFFFVAEASQPISGASLPTAKIELYSMYYGYYRRSSMNIEPGQSLAANLRVSGDFVLFDTAAIEADDAADYIEKLNAKDPDSQVPTGISTAPDRLSINLQTFLVQIASDPVASLRADQQVNTLIFRLADGTLSNRSPAHDRSTTLYEQAQSSATQAARSSLRPTGQPAKSPAADLFMPIEP